MDCPLLLLLLLLLGLALRWRCGVVGCGVAWWEEVYGRGWMDDDPRLSLVYKSL